jgi:hypothetical protein
MTTADGDDGDGTDWRGDSQCSGDGGAVGGGVRVPRAMATPGGGFLVELRPPVLPDGLWKKSEDGGGKMAGGIQTTPNGAGDTEVLLREIRLQRELILGLRAQMEAVARGNAALRTAKARLEQMHGEGLFGFVQKVDREARDLFFAILAAGDTAKASRQVSLKDSTLRSKIKQWRKRGKAYAALAEFIRWRKSIKGQAGIDFAKRLASGAERDMDYGALVRDTVEELEQFNPENWEERCESLAAALRGSLLN